MIHSCTRLKELRSYLQARKWLSSPLVRYRMVLIVPIHLCLFLLAAYWAFLVRFDWQIPARLASVLPLILLAVVIARGVTFWVFQGYQGMLRRVSFYDLVTLLKAITAGSLLLLGGWFVFERPVPSGLLVIEWFMTLTLVGGLRMASRLWGQAVYPKGAFRRAVFVGTLSDLELVIGYIRRSRHGQYYPVACVDQEGIHTGMRINGIPLWSKLDKVPRLVRRYGVQEIVFCSSDSSREVMNHLVETCSGPSVSFKLLPPLKHALEGSKNEHAIRDLTLEDIVNRKPIRLDETLIARQIQGRRGLVTGAGGSIGREICLQIVRFQPECIILFDRYESSLYSIQLEFTDRYPQQQIHPVLGTVSDAQGFSRLLDQLRPDTIFHCAAYKHVPVVELNPVEAGYNNILGTRHVARAALVHGVDKFVMISTDKAVNPTSVMGASKRLAEMYVQALNGRCRTRFITVRFGNVLNSAGSVIPRFLEQIRSGGPVTVTHPEIERFFMSIPEACQLVLQAAAMGQGGEIFVLNMGRPVRILDLARKLVRLAGREEGKDIEIVLTGLRPGEKLYEELFDRDEEPLPTDCEHIRMAWGRVHDFDRLEKEFDEIERLVSQRDEPGIIRKLNAIVPNCSCGMEVLKKYRDLAGEGTEDGGKHAGPDLHSRP